MSDLNEAILRESTKASKEADGWRDTVIDSANHAMDEDPTMDDIVPLALIWIAFEIRALRETIFWKQS